MSAGDGCVAHGHLPKVRPSTTLNIEQLTRAMDDLDGKSRLNCQSLNENASKRACMAPQIISDCELGSSHDFNQIEFLHSPGTVDYTTMDGVFEASTTFWESSRPTV